MKKKPFLFSITLLFLVFSLFGFSGRAAGAEDSFLKIQALPDQYSVKNGMMFLVHVQAANSSSDTSVEFWSNSCSYEKHWVTDNSAVLIQSWTCNENTLEQVTLSPGDAYEKNIILYIPGSDKTGPVVFRLGFKRMSENGDVSEPLWSDPVTMNVIVPEEIKEETPSPAVAADPEAPAGSQPLVFQDPGVPIKVPPGKGFSIRLASNPSTGFRWKMTLPEDQEIIKFIGSEHVVSQEVMPGVPGEEVYRFEAVTPGATNVDFVYERPWEPKVAPTRKIFTILVQEN